MSGKDVIEYVKTVPNYDLSCDVCSHSPTVSLVDNNDNVIDETNLCGICCFGNSECIDPEKW